MSKDLKPPTPRDTKRVQLDLAPEPLAELMLVKEGLQASTYAEALRRSIKFILKILTEQKNGGTFFIKCTDGSIKEIVF